MNWRAEQAAELSDRFRGEADFDPTWEDAEQDRRPTRAEAEADEAQWAPPADGDDWLLDAAHGRSTDNDRQEGAA